MQADVILKEYRSPCLGGPGEPLNSTTPAPRAQFQTVKPYMSHTSQEFMKYRLGNISMGFILFYINLSIAKINK